MINTLAPNWLEIIRLYLSLDIIGCFLEAQQQFSATFALPNVFFSAQLFAEKYSSIKLAPNGVYTVYIEIIPWKVRTNDFYSRVAMHRKNERRSAENE